MTSGVVPAAIVVEEALDWLTAAVDRAPDDAWQRPAGDLTWTRHATFDHLLDDLVAYALQLTGAREGAAAREDYLPVIAPAGGDDLVGVPVTCPSAVRAQVLGAFGGLFVAALASSPSNVRAYHPWGLTDPTGYAAMALIEVLVHGHDLLTGVELGFEARLPTRPAAFTLARAFPDAPAGDPAQVLLWCTGRAGLSGPDGPLPRPTSWRGDLTVR